MSLHSRQRRAYLQATPDAFVFKVGGRYVALEHKTGGPMNRNELNQRAARVDRWFTALAVIATVGAVLCIALALGGGIKPGALPSALPAWVMP